MKLVTILLSLSCLSMSATASEVLSTRVFSTDARSENLPTDLHFQAEEITVINPSWYGSLFHENCQNSLETATLKTPVEVKVVGPREIELSLNNRWSKQVHNGRASYVPVYYKRGQAIHPHFMVKLQDGFLLHVTISKHGLFFSRKKLTVSLVHGRGDHTQLIPIFTAIGE